MPFLFEINRLTKTNLNRFSNVDAFFSRTIGRGEGCEEHELIAKFCQHLHTQEAAKPNSLGASNDFEDRLNETPFERQDLIQVNYILFKLCLDEE